MATRDVIRFERNHSQLMCFHGISAPRLNIYTTVLCGGGGRELINQVSGNILQLIVRVCRLPLARSRARGLIIFQARNRYAARVTDSIHT